MSVRIQLPRYTFTCFGFQIDRDRVQSGITTVRIRPDSGTGPKRISGSSLRETVFGVGGCSTPRANRLSTVSMLLGTCLGLSRIQLAHSTPTTDLLRKRI